MTLGSGLLMVLGGWGFCSSLIEYGAIFFLKSPLLLTDKLNIHVHILMSEEVSTKAVKFNNGWSIWLWRRSK